MIGYKFSCMMFRFGTLPYSESESFIDKLRQPRTVFAIHTTEIKINMIDRKRKRMGESM